MSVRGIVSYHDDARARRDREERRRIDAAVVSSRPASRPVRLVKAAQPVAARVNEGWDDDPPYRCPEYASVDPNHSPLRCVMERKVAAHHARLAIAQYGIKAVDRALLALIAAGAQCADERASERLSETAEGYATVFVKADFAAYGSALLALSPADRSVIFALDPAAAAAYEKAQDAALSEGKIGGDLCS